MSDKENKDKLGESLPESSRDSVSCDSFGESCSVTSDILEAAEKIDDDLLKKKTVNVDEDHEKKFSYLLDLLTRSKFYSDFLVKRMLEQQEEKKKIKTKLINRKIGKIRRSSVIKETSKTDRASKQDKELNQSLKRRHSDTEEVPKSKRHKLESALASAKSEQNSPDDSGHDSEEEKEVVIADPSEQIRNNKQPELVSGAALRPYQLVGYEWLKVLYENGVNGILADEMGLGKTIQCISIIAHFYQTNVNGPFLIIAPLSTLYNWANEFNKFAPKIPHIVYHGSIEERSELRKRLMKRTTLDGKLVYPVVITSYSMILNDKKYLRIYNWKYMVIDEGHRIKNHQCQLVKELKLYQVNNRLLLTGTPLQNNLSELWSLLHFLLPEIFDNLDMFESWFDARTFSDKESDDMIVAQEQEKHILSTMHQILTPFLLRRTKADVDLGLPPKKELLVYAPLSVEQCDFYKQTVEKTILEFFSSQDKAEVLFDVNGRPKRGCKELAMSYKELSDSEYFSATPDVFDETPKAKKTNKRTSYVRMSLRNRIMQLRKICNHPYLIEQPLNENNEMIFNPNFVKISGKLSLLDSMLTELKKRKHKVLLFCQMVRMIDILAEFCIERNHKFCSLIGQDSLAERDEAIKLFNEDESVFIFIISTRAGGLGINLVGADTVILYDSDWNPQVDLQAQDRCHRMGQTKPVVVYRLVTANTVDEEIVIRANNKRKLEKMIIQKGRFTTGCSSEEDNNSIKPEDLLKILKSSDQIQVRDAEKQFHLTKEQLDLLLDRSTMYDQKSTQQNVAGLFKVMDAAN